MDMSRDANVYETDVSYYSCGFVKAAHEYSLTGNLDICPELM